MMFLHRTFGIVIAVVLVWIVSTGTLIQLADLRALVSDASAWDPDMQDIRAHGNGPPNYAVLAPPDYTAPALPVAIDCPGSLARIASLAHAAAPGAPLRLIELRMVEGKPAGHVLAGTQHLIFDLTSGAVLPDSDVPVDAGQLVPSARETFKSMHRFRFISPMMVTVSSVGGIVLALMIFTGLAHYFRLLASRRKLGRVALLWRGGGWWRDLHRWLSVVAGIFVVVLTLSGIALAINCVAQELSSRSHRSASDAVTSAPATPTTPLRNNELFTRDPSSFTGLYYWAHRSTPGAPPKDQTSPLRDDELAPMAHVTLGAFNKAMPGTAIRVLRLRYFAGYPQGVVITGGRDPKQLVYNAVTGRAMAVTEPGYPDTGFPSGWQGYQWIKAIHSGELFGMPGRLFETIGGLALVYLSVSGIVMYYRLWARRRDSGRTSLFWR